MEETASTATRWRLWPRRRLWQVVLTVVLLVLAYTAFRLIQADLAGSAGRSDLLKAERAMQKRDIPKALKLLRDADHHFADMRSDLDTLGPIEDISRHVPLLRVQIRGAEAFAHAGRGLSQAGIAVAISSDRLIHPKNPDRPLSDAVGDLRDVGATVTTADTAVHDAQQQVDALDGYRLLGPLGGARHDLKERLGDIVSRIDELDGAMALTLDIIGANGPRRYLILTQNPDEVRPTGGYIGTYGLLSGDGGHIKLLQYGAGGVWAKAHPQAAIPPKRAPFVFQYATPPQEQTISNVNVTADFPAAAELAATMWRRGGEQPINGVLSLEPTVLARLVQVLGSVRVPAYHETVTAANVQQRIDFYTHGAPSKGKSDAERKDFIAELAHAVLARMLTVHGDQWLDVATGLRTGLKQREAMVWSADAHVQSAIARLGWDGSLPTTTGDFYADAEWEYAAKNGSGLLRTFDHTVTLHADGSGSATTVMTLRDTYDAKHYANLDSLSYVTPYGPVGGTLNRAASDPPLRSEPNLSGHPTAGWIRTAQPLGSTQLRVTWDVPGLLIRTGDHTWTYQLTWLPQPGHDGDVLDLTVSLPKGWHWIGAPPPRHISLTGPFHQAWKITEG
jgi:hypothetical protein